MTLTQHLQSGVTTLCYCWIITRQDATVIGITDHDRDVVLNGVTCSSTTGIVTTKYEQVLGLTADDMEIEGVIDDTLIVEDDVRAGRFDFAAADVYIVNWNDPTEYKHVASGTLGEVIETDGGAFSTNFLSKKDILLQPTGRVFQRSCDTKLGSPRCGVDTSLPAYETSATVTAVDGSLLTLTGAESYATDWFTLGRLTTASGYEIGIRLHDGNTFDLWRVPDVTIAVNDTVVITAGCKQDIETCRVKFNNVVNFQGFHLIPGNDQLTEYPVRGKGDYDGESLFR